MMKMRYPASIAITVCLMSLAAFAQTNGNADEGKRLFMKHNCYYCHGTTGQGGRDGARIAQTALNLQGLLRYVRKPTGGMPAFTEKILADRELTDIYAYLKSLPVAKAPKDIPLLNDVRDK
jgi:mono/diheme cytochrome c family protein